eukprot:8137935-Alexandrium_andersonii.AAC.1
MCIRDRAEAAHAGAVVQRFGGVARHMVREVPVEVFTLGRGETDEHGNDVRVTGLEYVARGLARRYGVRALET